jgi:hypothetical protein
MMAAPYHSFTLNQASQLRSDPGVVAQWTADADIDGTGRIG